LAVAKSGFPKLGRLLFLQLKSVPLSEFAEKPLQILGYWGFGVLQKRSVRYLRMIENIAPTPPLQIT